MLIATGLKVSELIERLNALESEHGDCYVFLRGSDYPTCCDGAEYLSRSDTYYPPNVIRLY